MRPKDLLDRLQAQPFRRFRIHLADQSTLNVRQPRMAIVGLDHAVLATRFRVDAKGRGIALDWRTIALADIVQLTEVTANRRKRR
jgi:hypothetical protein